MNQEETKEKKKVIGNNLNKVLLGVAFGLYLILLIWVIGLKMNAEWLPEVGVELRSLSFKNRSALIPFKTFFDRGLYFNDDYFFNVLIYIPMGLILPFIFKKPWVSFILIVLSSAIFEVSQLFTGFGGCDTTDLICNILGGVLGMMVYYIFRKKVPDKAINITNLVVIILASPVCVYAIVNSIINWQLYVIS